MQHQYGTTIYTPVEGGHRYVRSEGPGWTACAVEGCGQDYWKDIHQLAESHGDIDVKPGLFAVEASDDNGRSYATNGLRWPSEEDAKLWAGGLALRWFGCTNIRVVTCDDAGNPTDTVVQQVL